MKAARRAVLLVVASSFRVAGSVDDANNPAVAEEEDYDDDDFFPPIIDASDVAYFFSSYDLDGLHWALTNVHRRSARYNHQNHDTGQTSSSGGGESSGSNSRRRRGGRELPETMISRGGGDAYTTEYKLRHDLDQARYLSRALAESDARASRYFGAHVAPIYERVLGGMPSLNELKSTRGLYSFTTSDYDLGIHSVYNKALYVTTSDELDPGWRDMSSVLGDGLDWDAIQGDWFGEVGRRRRASTTTYDAPTMEGGVTTDVVDDVPPIISPHSAPGMIVIDNILSPRTLSIVRNLLLRNTHWFQTKTPLEFGKYVGSYIDDGLNDPIFLEIAKEMHMSMPRIMDGHDLRYMWAYKYDSEWESGINLHADMAAVNVNVWLSADGADLMEEGYGGGLVVFTARPPDDWTFESYNNADTDHVIETLLRPTDFANVTVHHRPNRAVIFDSALFHMTEKYRFRRGYENGRINLTFLFGEMRGGVGGGDESCNSSSTTTTSTADR